MLPIVPLPPLKQKRKNSKTNISTINNQIISSPSQIDKSKNNPFAINTSSKIINNNDINVNKINNNKNINININKIIKRENIEKTEKKEIKENLNISFLDNAIFNFSKGLYYL